SAKALLPHRRVRTIKLSIGWKGYDSSRAASFVGYPQVEKGRRCPEGRDQEAYRACRGHPGPSDRNVPNVHIAQFGPCRKCRPPNGSVTRTTAKRPEAA